ncbi:MAG: deoxyribose-phosphate aldolase [Dysgonamonadaceae bacterium]|jgi:deoxyribose-phosphate aldolase|nr:deoxyribose-phosphate aldolase [Dysgonamonadaceae bacterium]
MNKYEQIFSQFDLNLSDEIISKKVEDIIRKIDENVDLDILRFLYSSIDLTSLNSDDSKESIRTLAEKVNDLEESVSHVKNVAGICVYPNFVQTLKETLTADVQIVSVAGGFPSSQTFMEVKMAEIALAVSDGADEIDIVLNGGLFLNENYDEVADELHELKHACRGAKLKVILETGLLKSAIKIKKAAILSIYSGADFLKTSTGKVYQGASPEAVFVICETIKEYYLLYDKKIGIKISGGIKSINDAVLYYFIVKEVLGKEWLSPDYFRIGASSLADNLLKVL